MPNKERYTKEDLLHWEHNPDRQCLQIKNRYGIAVESITDEAYLSQSKEDRLNMNWLYRITEDYYQAQKCRIQEESECR